MVNQESSISLPPESPPYSSESIIAKPFSAVVDSIVVIGKVPPADNPVPISHSKKHAKGS